TSTGSAQSTSTPTGPATIQIAVGANGFTYTPNQVNASVGDTIRFNFYPGGHTVARAEFEHPCIPYEYTGPNKVGFFSGNISPQVISNNLPHFDVLVNDTNPIFFYCTAPGSCYQHQMVGVVNPSANETLAVQEQYAQNATFQLAPGDPWPSETEGPMPTATGTSSGSNSGGGSGGDGSSSHLSPGAIAGIAIGSAAVLILAAALVYLCGRRGGLDKAYRRSGQAFAPPAVAPGMVEAKYNNNSPNLTASGPKSPGQATFSTYSAPGDHDPYRSSMHPSFAGSPPLPPSSPGYSTYQSAYHTPPPEQQHYAAPPAQQHYAAAPAPAPVELPTVQNPPSSHTPLPQYQ
ncbi:hypothetical protein QBC46DRAFT_242562, partial [Diplogelasinospora grovesii]